jgi:hypothetical protein
MNPRILYCLPVLPCVFNGAPEIIAQHGSAQAPEVIFQTDDLLVVVAHDLEHGSIAPFGHVRRRNH